jgi:hypothetical protein
LREAPGHAVEESLLGVWRAAAQIQERRIFAVAGSTVCRVRHISLATCPPSASIGMLRDPCGVRELAPAVCRPGLPGRAATDLLNHSVILSGVSRAFAFARSAGTQDRAPRSTVSRAWEIRRRTSLRIT